MFTWKSTGRRNTEDDEPSAFTADTPAFCDTPSEWMAWSDDLWSDADAPVAANSDEFSRHEVMSAAQELALAHALQQAFTSLQTALVQTPAFLDPLMRHITDERWSNTTPLSHDEILLCDHVVTLHDQWRTVLHLAPHDADMQTLADQLYLALAHALQTFPLTRDHLLAVAKAAVASESTTQQHPLACHLHELYRLRNEFITRNIRLVYYIARRHLDRGLSLDDMVQEGVLGLFRATLKYDANAGTRFSTYAYWWIRQAIRDAIGRQRSLIRYPHNVGIQVNRLHAFRQRYWWQHGCWPDHDTLGRHTGMTTRQVRDLLGLSNFCISADSPVRDDDDRRLLDDLSENETLPPPHIQYEHSERAALIERYFSRLPEREATVLRLKYGIGHDKMYTLHEIAPVIGVSPERVRQLEKLALEKIRKQAGEEPLL